MSVYRVYDLGVEMRPDRYAFAPMLAELHCTTLFCAMVVFCQAMAWNPKEVELLNGTTLERAGRRFEVRTIVRENVGCIIV